MTGARSEGALRNVGELASPYYLLELWVRQDDIAIDPETFATLKQKTRRLVRDARVFESRGDAPDAEWLWRRRDLLGLTDTLDKVYQLEDGTEVELKLWRDDEGRECLLIGELPDYSDPDERNVDENDPYSTRFEGALDVYDGEADWGLLLAWPEIRIYRRSSGISQQFLGLNLEKLAELDEDANWRAFAGLFRGPAFAPDASGVPLIRRVVDESRRHAARLADDMRADVVEAAEALIQGALDHPLNRDLVDPSSREALYRLFEETLYYLYRLLFVLYAEARDVLPLSGAGAYATTYSVDHLVELGRREPEHAGGDYYGQTLRRLFGLLWAGPKEATEALGFEPVGGELFDPGRTRLIDQLTIPDPAWRSALVSIALGAADSPRRRLGRRSSFAELDVDRLGSIYEGLLVLEPYVAQGPRHLVRQGSDRRVVEPGTEGDLKVVRQLNAGDFVLESASGRRKGSGSFYTPAEITEYLAHAALDPLVEPIVARASEDAVAAEKAILELNVCDPAMGSGAFLVQAARVLGRALARVRAIGREGRVTPEMVRRAERAVVRTCLYGVDINPLAVTLAKVSLWLETLEPGQPLSFLDAHLRVGDSLVGVEFSSSLGSLTAAELMEWPKEATKGLRAYLLKEAGPEGNPLLEALAKRRGSASAIQPRLPGLDITDVEKALAEIAQARENLVAGNGETEPLQLELALQRRFAALEEAEDSLRNRLREAADFWCAQWFSEGEGGPRGSNGRAIVPASQAEYEEVVTSIIRGEAPPERLTSQLEAAWRIARGRRFFHWALEFPEVLLERGGFDAVIGNPPWNTLSPDVKEFFSTYDHTTFRPGVPKADQERRKAELRADPDIDAAWRSEARFLHELSAYAKPESGRFRWYAPSGQLRKGDANVFRLFVERGYKLLRKGGRLGQVLPDSVYVSSPATGVRQGLLTDGVLERCYVFENRRGLFPIHGELKIVLLTVGRGGGPTNRFKVAFFTGKSPTGQSRAVSLEDLPSELARLDEEAAELSVEQIRTLAPETWSFPELQTAMDAQIAAQCGAQVPPLNLDERGWRLTYCAELHADRDAWRFHSAEDLQSVGAERHGLRWVETDGTEWWPLVEGALFYLLEFPMEGKEPTKWVNSKDLARVEARLAPDGSSVGLHARVAWRKVARSVDERSAIATVLPPRTICKDSAYTVLGGSLDERRVLALASLYASFVFDYLVRFAGRSNLTYVAVNAMPAPTFDAIQNVVTLAAQVVCGSDEFDALWTKVCGTGPRPRLDRWEIGQCRARVDALVALAYGLSLEQYVAVLSTFPNLDTIQPMLVGEPKSFVTRDLALLTYCEETGVAPPDITKLLEAIKVPLPKPRDEYRLLDRRVARYRELGAIPYRPTPRGGRKPTDPELVEAVTSLLTAEPQAAAEVAEALEEDEKVVAQVLGSLEREGEVFAEGRGKRRRYYVIEAV